MRSPSETSASTAAARYSARSGEDEGQGGRLAPEPHELLLLEGITVHLGDLIEKGSGTQGYERHSVLNRGVLRQLLVPEVCNLWRLVGGEDAGEDKSADAGLCGRLGEVCVAHGVDLVGVLVAAGVSGGSSDDSVCSGHRSNERAEVEHVTAGDLHSLGFELGGIGAGPDQGSDRLAPLQEGVDDLAAEVAGASDDENGCWAQD